MCQNELDKAYFQDDVAYGDFNNLPRKTVFDKVLCDKVFTIITVIYSMIDINVDLHQLSANSLITKGPLLKQGPELFLRINNLIMNCASPSPENFRGIKYTHLTKITFGC